MNLARAVLAGGAHDTPADGVCAMEAASSLAGEPWSDRPACVCPAIGALVRAWNDVLPSDERDAFFLPLIPRLIGTAGPAPLRHRRAMLAVDWLVRSYLPAWLRAAGLDADDLARLPPIRWLLQVPSVVPLIERAKADASAAWIAARQRARHKLDADAWFDVREGVRNGVRDVAKADAEAAVRTTVEDAGWARVEATIWDAVEACVWAVAWAGVERAVRSRLVTAVEVGSWPNAWLGVRVELRFFSRSRVQGGVLQAVADAIAPTQADRRRSAVALIERMCAV